MTPTPVTVPVGTVVTFSPYPKTLTKSTTTVDTVVVNDPDEEAKAIADGFSNPPLVAARPVVLGRVMGHPFHMFPLHLYHATKPAIVANDSETEAKALADGYTTTYVLQEYPKMVHVEVADAAGQVKAKADGFVYSGDPNAPFPRTCSKTITAPPTTPVPPAPPSPVVVVPNPTPAASPAAE
jgi:hypothetical protein